VTVSFHVFRRHKRENAFRAKRSPQERAGVLETRRGFPSLVSQWGPTSACTDFNPPPITLSVLGNHRRWRRLQVHVSCHPMEPSRVASRLKDVEHMFLSSVCGLRRFVLAGIHLADRGETSPSHHEADPTTNVPSPSRSSIFDPIHAYPTSATYSRSLLARLAFLLSLRTSCQQ